MRVAIVGWRNCVDTCPSLISNKVLCCYVNERAKEVRGSKRREWANGIKTKR